MEHRIVPLSFSDDILTRPKNLHFVPVLEPNHPRPGKLRVTLHIEVVPQGPRSRALGEQRVEAGRGSAEPARGVARGRENGQGQWGQGPEQNGKLDHIQSWVSRAHF